MKMRAPKGEGALAHRGARRLHHRPRRAGGPAGARCAASRRGRPARSARRPLRARPRVRRAAAASAPRRGMRQRGADRAGARLSRAGHRHQRRAVRRRQASGRSSTCSPASITTPRSTQAGRLLARNAERYLKSPEVMAELFADRPDALAGTAGAGRAARVHDGRSRLSVSELSGAARRDGDVVPAPHRRGRRARSLSPVSRQGARADRPRARSDREARSRRLLPDRLGHRQLLPPAEHPGAGPRLGGQQRRLLQPRDHRGRSDQDGAAVRALPLRRARRVAGHRSRSAERRPARARHPARLREIRPAGRGDDRQRDHLSRPQRRARGRQGALARRGRRSTGSRR